MVLAPVLGNPIAMAAFGIDRTLPALDQLSALGEGLTALLPQLTALSEILPGPTLQWKLKLLVEGNSAIQGRYKEVMPARRSKSTSWNLKCNF